VAACIALLVLGARGQLKAELQSERRRCKKLMEQLEAAKFFAGVSGAANPVGSPMPSAHHPATPSQEAAAAVTGSSALNFSPLVTVGSAGGHGPLPALPEHREGGTFMEQRVAELRRCGAEGPCSFFFPCAMCCALFSARFSVLLCCALCWAVLYSASLCIRG
jgi:hypothetical protein